MSQQSYALLTDENQSSKDRIVELTRDIKAAKDTLDAKRKELEEKTKLLLGKESELEDIQVSFMSILRVMKTKWGLFYSLGEAEASKHQA